jgi:hypothetical protein
VARLFGSIGAGVSGRGFFDLAMIQLSRGCGIQIDVAAGPAPSTCLTGGVEGATSARHEAVAETAKRGIIDLLRR